MEPVYIDTLEKLKTKNVQVNPFEYFLSGSCGGLVTCLVGHPFDTVKVRLQTQPIPKAGEEPHFRGAFDCARKTVQKEGVLGLYRGMQAPLLGNVPMIGVLFGSFGAGKKIFKADIHPESFGRTFCAGGFAGFFNGLIAAPTERVKCLLQIEEGTVTKKYDGMIDCTKKLLKEGGIRSVFKGTYITLIRDISSNAVYFSVYNELTRKLSKEGDRPSPPVSVFCGGTAGVANWIVAIPSDVIKSRLQTAPEGKYPMGMISVFAELIKTEGVLGFYTGFVPVMLRSFPANAACFLAFEICLKLFVALHNDDATKS